MNRKITVTLLALFLFATKAGATSLQGREVSVSLSSQQRESLMRITCSAFGTSRRARTQARREDYKGSTLYVSVLCPTAQKVESFPTYQRYSCYKDSGEPWNCSDADKLVRVNVSSRRVFVSYTARETTLQDAID